MGIVSRMLRTCNPGHKTKRETEQRDITTACKASVAITDELSSPSCHEAARMTVDSKTTESKSSWVRKLLGKIKTGKRDSQLSDFQEHLERLEGSVGDCDEFDSLSNENSVDDTPFDNSATAATTVAVLIAINTASDGTDHQHSELSGGEHHLQSKTSIESTTAEAPHEAVLPNDVIEDNNAAAQSEATEVEQAHDTTPPPVTTIAPSPSSDPTLVDGTKDSDAHLSWIREIEAQNHPDHMLLDQSDFSDIQPVHYFIKDIDTSPPPKTTSPTSDDQQKTHRYDSARNSDDDENLSDVWQDLAIEVDAKTARELFKHLKQQEQNLASERAVFEKEKEELKAEKDSFEAEYKSFQKATEKLMANIEAAVKKNDTREAALEEAEKAMTETEAGLSKERLNKQTEPVATERREFEDHRGDLTRERYKLMALVNNMHSKHASEEEPAINVLVELNAITEEEEPEERSQDEINAILQQIVKVTADPERERYKDLTILARAAEANARDAKSGFEEMPDRARKVRWAESNETKLFLKRSIITKTETGDESSGELGDDESSSDMSSSEDDEEIWERMVVSGF